MAASRRRTAAALVLGLLAACSDSTAPSPSIVDTWALLSFTDHGIVGVTTGTATFFPNDTFAIVGTVTYPGEPIDSLNVVGSYLVTGTVLSITAGPDSGDWDMRWTGQRYVLTLRGPRPTNRITLGRLPQVASGGIRRGPSASRRTPHGRRRSRARSHTVPPTPPGNLTP